MSAGISSLVKQISGSIDEWVHPHKKRVYHLSEGSIDDKNLLGNKGANLCEMHRLGLNVPSAFVITTETCLEYFEASKAVFAAQSTQGTLGPHARAGAGAEELKTTFPEHFEEEYVRHVHQLERETGKTFGIKANAGDAASTHNPLLLSVRSGAAVSMPGMMDTVLNLGINDEVVDAMVRLSGNPRWAYDTYRRFLQMYGDVVLGVDKALYEDVLSAARKQRAVHHDSELTSEDLRDIVSQYKKITNVPHDPWDQLRSAIEAVFNSWYSPRAVKYRDINGIAATLGTGVVVQSMVYGNMNDASGSGVGFTRDPATGTKLLYGEYLSNAEGEDVVSGVRTPMTLADLQRENAQIHDELVAIMHRLENHYKDMQDIEFTVENGKLYILQTRTGKRTARAAVHIAVEMVGERMITEREALLRIDPHQMDFFMHPMIDPAQAKLTDPAVASRVLGKGLAASAGAAVGKAAFSCEQAEALAKAGERCILVRNETSADDIGGMKAAAGALTLHGGLTSHAAVVMRGMGKPTVTGLRNAVLDAKARTLTASMPLPDGSFVSIKEGDVITIDGSSGMVFTGAMPTMSSGKDSNFQTVMEWADKYKRLKVMGNGETPADVQKAHDMGAEGIGLCRTEHMFFHPARIDIFRQMILSNTKEERVSFLNKLQPLQQQDFLEMFRIMRGRQVTVRLLDPPLHEFLPDPKAPDFNKQLWALAQRLGMSDQEEELRERVLGLQETNSMLGFRGCRISIVYPEIVEMQTRAIAGAAVQACTEGVPVHPQIMIPLVCTDHEIDLITPTIAAAVNSELNAAVHDGAVSAEAKDLIRKMGTLMGTMIEIPRACIRADKIAAAKYMSFVSFGSNDLTQLTFGFSRDDSCRFMGTYLDKHLVAKDPFVTLDVAGVGTMIQMAVTRARQGNPRVKVGLCGEHGGDPDSIAFLNRIGLDYVSCSPFRIPIARVAAARAAIQEAARQQEAAEKEMYRQVLASEVELW